MRSRHSEVSLRAPWRVFVAGTDTGIGKTETSCALLSLLADQGLSPVPFKPYESGCDDLRRPADALAMQLAARSRDPLSRICVHRFREPLAPGIAAARLGVQPSFAQVLKVFRSHAGRPLVAEAAGGLRVPIDDRREILDLIAALSLPVLLVARAGLGTLNHIALSLDALATRKQKVLGVVLSQSQRQRDLSMEDNAAWIQRRHKVRVLGPVPFETIPSRRRVAFREALRPLLQFA
jgi:dethiobiotin synthetase